MYVKRQKLNLTVFKPFPNKLPISVAFLGSITGMCVPFNRMQVIDLLAVKWYETKHRRCTTLRVIGFPPEVCAYTAK